MHITGLNRCHPTRFGVASSHRIASHGINAILAGLYVSLSHHPIHDLLVHPLTSQLQACNSAGNILIVLQQQVRGPDQFHGDDRWTNWLDPTVNAFFAFSGTLEAGVGLVCPKTWTCLYEICTLIFIWQVLKITFAVENT